MSMICFDTREEWLAARRKYITSTEVGSLLGGGMRSAWRIWAEKRGIIEPPDFSNEDWSICGLAMEDALRKVYMKKTGRTVVPARPWTLWVCDECPVLAASCDHEIIPEDSDERPPLEGKASSRWTLKEWDSNAGGPLPYVWQLHAQMVCKGQRWGSLAAIIDSTTFRAKDHKRDEETSRRIMETARWMMRLVETGEPPPVDGSDDETEVMNQVLPEIDKRRHEIAPEFLAKLVEELREVRAKIAELNRTNRQLRNKLVSAAGTTSVFTDEEERPLVTFYRTQPKVYTVTRRGYRGLRIASDKKEDDDESGESND